MSTKHIYSDEPEDKQLFTEKFDQSYSQFARLYDRVVKTLPIWRNWLNQALPMLQGNHVLEISFGTGYLLPQYADHFITCCGIDYNKAMATIAQENLRQHDIRANLQVGNVETLPYTDASFDTLVNTMAFSGYPDAKQALSEMHRVLKPGGRLVMIDINYPTNGNWIGTLLTKVWQYGGDVIRDMEPLFKQFGFQYTDAEVGGFGTVHLYVATKL